MRTGSLAPIGSAEYHAGLDPERYVARDVEAETARYREGRHHPAHGGSVALRLFAELEGEVVGFIDARLERSEDAMHRDRRARRASEPRRRWPVTSRR